MEAGKVYVGQMHREGLGVSLSRHSIQVGHAVMSWPRDFQFFCCLYRNGP